MQIKEGGGQVSFHVKDYGWGCGIFASLILWLTLISVSMVVIATSCISILGDDSGGDAGMTAPYSPRDFQLCDCRYRHGHIRYPCWWWCLNFESSGFEFTTQWINGNLIIKRVRAITI